MPLLGGSRTIKGGAGGSVSPVASPGGGAQSSSMFTGPPTAPARAKDTVYQAGSTARLIVLCTESTGTVCDVQVATNAGFTTGVLVLLEFYSAGQMTVVAIIPPNYYYRVRSNAGALTVRTWTELNL